MQETEIILDKLYIMHRFSTGKNIWHVYLSVEKKVLHALNKFPKLVPLIFTSFYDVVCKYFNITKPVH